MPKPVKPAPKKKANTTVDALIVLVLAVAGILALIYMNFAPRDPDAALKAAVKSAAKAREADPTGYYLDATYPHPKPAAGAPELKVLFIGNSYTLVNNLPYLVEAVADSDTLTPVDFKPGLFGKGGNTLEMLYSDPAGHEMLYSYKWDYVVIQDMSTLPADLSGEAIMYRGVTKWNNDIQPTGAKVAVYEVWIKKPGSEWYTNKEKTGLDLVNPQISYQKVHDVTNNLAGDIGAMIVPVGDYWESCRDFPGMPQFYHPDGSHPSLAGSYLAALLFYRALSGHSLAGVTYIPPGLAPDQADILKRCASG